MTTPLSAVGASVNAATTASSSPARSQPGLQLAAGSPDTVQFGSARGDQPSSKLFDGGLCSGGLLACCALPAIIIGGLAIGALTMAWRGVRGIGRLFGGGQS
ncbi:MAG: hypothetical protein KC474_10085 [Cyanobacteria bacterium HKST-UBA04]|nr:hypothetical protein [Cyanobacteria bacterium HKST-UBA05]MCA9799888.1 hypothetical protein [Cyanobacteria bacterium HKST-UBA04]MCA9840560.1 hypothetical protein [Cyanobacteria bacterium HKST-UBA03]